MSELKKSTLRAGSNPVAPRSAAPSNTEGAQHGFRGSPLQGGSSLGERRRSDMTLTGHDNHGRDDDATPEILASLERRARELDVETARRRQLRVELQRCELEVLKNTDSSDGESADSCMSVDSKTQKRRRNSSSDEDKRAERAAHRKKGRGRPPTSGQYIGLAQAKRELAAAEREIMYAEAERDVMALTRNLRTPRLSESPGTESPIDKPTSPGDLTCTALGERIGKAIDTIMGVRNRSKNLSGPMMKALGDAVNAIRDASVQLLERTATQETLALRKQNAQLRGEVDDLRRDVEKLRRELASASRAKITETQPAPAPSNLEEMLKRAVQEAVAISNARMSARFEGLEARLLPAPRIRPPLASDRRDIEEVDTPALMPSSSRTPEVTTLMPPANPAKTPATAKRSKKKDKTKAPPKKRQEEGNMAPLNPDRTKKRKDDDWQTVTKRRQVQKKKEGPPKKSGQKAAPKRPGPPKLRTPTTSAVVMQLGPTAEKRGTTYADILSRAKANIKLAEHGIPSVRFKRAATGARLLVLPGVDSGEKADLLAAKLKEIFDDDVLKISRPTKCVGVRVCGLDDHSRKEDVIAAIAEAGGVPPEQIRAGELSRSDEGRGAIIVQCPVGAAKRIQEKGRLQIGWVSAQFKLLDARSPRCFKCLEAGHLAAACKSEIDRSGLCFRCGEEGHRASGCGAEAPKCAICTAAGRPASHKMGGAACAAPSSRARGGRNVRKKKKTDDGPRAPSSSCSGPSVGAGSAATQAIEEAMVTDEPGPSVGAQVSASGDGPARKTKGSKEDRARKVGGPEAR